MAAATPVPTLALNGQYQVSCLPIVSCFKVVSGTPRDRASLCHLSLGDCDCQDLCVQPPRLFWSHPLICPGDLDKPGLRWESFTGWTCLCAAMSCICGSGCESCQSTCLHGGQTRTEAWKYSSPPRAQPHVMTCSCAFFALQFFVTAF